MLGLNRVIAKYVKSCCQMCDIISMSSGNALAPIGATQYNAQLGLPDKVRAIKGLFVCNNWDLEPLDLLNGLALGL